MAKLYFRYSAMNAGKSTALLQIAHYEEQGGSPSSRPPLTTALDHVDIEEPWRRIAPVAERAHGNRATDCETDPGLSTTFAVDVLTRLAEQTVDARGTNPQEALLYGTRWPWGSIASIDVGISISKRLPASALTWTYTMQCTPRSFAKSSACRFSPRRSPS